MGKDTNVLINQVSINGRFMRSARIDMDLKGTPPLEGYVLQASTEKALGSMARSKAETGQSAFTWTGPYGGGKSSTALLVGNLIGGEPKSQKLAQKLAGNDLTALFRKAFPKSDGPWRVVPVTGSRTSLRHAIAEEAACAFGWDEQAAKSARAADKNLVTQLSEEAASSGVVLILDELGKFLEAAATKDHDAHLLQDLAEISSRSDGRLVIIGILHQAFEAYADKVSIRARTEWSKIQGRFQDLSFLSAAGETVRLIGRAIETEIAPPSAKTRASTLANYISERRPTDTADLKAALSQVWPLNPICALLLGGITRRRFGQNERSVFGFLASGEAFGFSEFLKATELETEETYDPGRLWDYLNLNFGLSLASGPQAAQFNLALEAIDRAAAKGSDLHRDLTKAAALIELFKNGSGLGVDEESLALAIPEVKTSDILGALKDLSDWGVLLGPSKGATYALFAGSDFEIDLELDKFRTAPDTASFSSALAAAGLRSVVAKRHYFDKGVLRSFELILSDLGDSLDVEALAKETVRKASNSSGAMVLLLHPKPKLSKAEQKRKAALVNALSQADIVYAIATTQDAENLVETSSELGALIKMQSALPQLAGDQIARRAVRARVSQLRNTIALGIQSAIYTARWVMPQSDDEALGYGAQLAASKLADLAFHATPIVHSELLQKDRPSSSAAAALRALLYAMVEDADDENLGFEGFPAARGLYLTVLRALGLHREMKGVYAFYPPKGSEAAESLKPAWDVFRSVDQLNLETVYRIWAAPPFGMKRGIMPVIALAYILANRERIAVYQDNLFQVAIDDLFVDRMLQSAASISFRKTDRDKTQSAFLSDLAKRLECPNDSALIVAQALFGRIEDLTKYAQQTQRISKDARRIRDTIRHASDPEALLFDALPALKVKGSLVDAVLNALNETEDAYPSLLQDLRETTAHALGTDTNQFKGIAKRAKSVIHISSDLKFDAYAQRVAGFEGGGGDIEAFAGPLQDKPVRDWSDRNRDGAIFEIASFARQFKQAEAVASVLKRKSGTEAIALIVGVNPNEAPVVQSFELSPNEQKTAERMAKDIVDQLSGKKSEQPLQLAALARAVAALTRSQEQAHD